MAELIDVFQRYQGEIDWPAVRRAGVDMAYIKVTNGRDRASPLGDHYVQGCHDAGVVAGGYAYALGGDPLAQAAVFAGELRRLGLVGPGVVGLAPMLDFEDPSLPTDPHARRGWIVAFTGYLHRLVPEAVKQLLYSNADELNEFAAGTIGVAGVQLLIWDAEWGPNDGINHPITAYHGTAAVHQYTSRGHVPGVGGLVDRDQVMGDIFEPSVPNPSAPGLIPTGTYLRIGSRGIFVTLLQQKLNRDYPLYSHLAVDGNYGPLTAGVVRQFQQRDRLLVDGIAGPQTLHALGLQ